MEFRVLPIKDKELFLKYAIPCGEVLVKRGDIKEELLRELNEKVSHGQEVDVPIENIFKVASRMCTIIARQMGKREIDAEVIRRYFMVEHEKAIRWRKQIYPDINLRDCIVYPGRVLSIDSDRALVKTPLGKSLLRSELSGKLKPGDIVSTHYDYISEKVSSDKLRFMARGRVTEAP